MKYIITDENEIRLGSSTFHSWLADNCKGRVVAAGHCNLINGKYEVFGESIGFRIKSKPEDADILNNAAEL